MNTYISYLKAENEHIEEDVTLDINGHQLNCFANICPFKLEVGARYEIALSLYFFDEITIEESDENRMLIEKLPTGFSYLLIGKVSAGIFNCGIEFSDELFLNDFLYLEGKYTKILVDRIDVEFISEAI
jgi:hypothetical protein